MTPTTHSRFGIRVARNTSDWRLPSPLARIIATDAGLAATLRVQDRAAAWHTLLADRRALRVQIGRAV